jgi:hypothetical protein
MRYYRIIIRDKNGNVLVTNFNGQPGFHPLPYDLNLSTYTSLNAGKSPFDLGSTNFAAQKIEVDIALTAMDAAVPSSFVRIWGVGLNEISQAANLNGLTVEVYGGMARGLPLANPSQSGLLARGQIIQSFGNWVGTSQTLDIFVGTLGSSIDSSQTTANPGKTLAPTNNSNPANIVFQWQAGQPFMVPLASMLQSAYPTYNIVGAVHPGLVWSGAASTGKYKTLGQFATWVRQKSLSIISGYAPDKSPGSYSGVTLALFNQTFSITDGTTQTTPKQIQFIDMVGQPTWVDAYTVQACCVMRADIQVGDFVILPDAPGITTAGGNSQYFNPAPNNNGYANAKSGSIFSGTFEVVAVRHVGDSRSAEHVAWVTTLDLIQAPANAQVVQKLPEIVKAGS